MRPVSDAAKGGGMRAGREKQVVEAAMLARIRVAKASWFAARGRVYQALAGLLRSCDEKDCFASSRAVGSETERFEELNDHRNFLVCEDTEESKVVTDRSHPLVVLMA